MPSDETVSYTVTDGVAVITIERPGVRNAMNLAVFDALAEQAARAGDDERAGAVLVRGRDGTFSAGLDTSLFGALSADPSGDGAIPGDGPTEELVARLQASLTAFEECDKPTVAAIEGHCLGGGLQLAAACHVRAVAPDAELAVLEPEWGLVPDLGGTWRLPRLVGLGRATELAMTARRIDAAEALAMGLAEVALEGTDPEGGALAYTAELASGPGAVRRLPRLMRENLRRDRADGLAAEARAQMACLSGPDFAEAVAAAMEDRRPEFVGR